MTDRPHTGGDMTDGIGNTARAHLETAEEIAATPTDIEVEVDYPRSSDGEVGADSEPSGGVTIGNRSQWPHAKVVLLMVSVGGDDLDRSYEEFVADIKRALDGVAKSATETGGYYIVNGKVCLPGDYDPGTRGFKPGAAPPQWAGGPAKATTSPASRETDREAVSADSAPRRRPAKKAARPTKVPQGASREEAVRTLAEGMNREVTGE